jgi:hypothetical protein
MKKHLILSLIIPLTLISCSSDDDSPSFDVNLLYDQWNFRNVCPDQNNLVLFEDGNYTLTESGNPCDDNRQNTWQYSGTFALNGDFISFAQETDEIIEEGYDSSGSTQTFGLELISEKIIYINESELFIERKFKFGNNYEYANWLLERKQ